MQILISGASISGPVLAYWLTRRGFDATVVERAPALRKTGGHAENRWARVAHLQGMQTSGAECPPGLKCQFLPAAYAQNSASPYDYGNYDLADRPADGLAVRYVVVHDTEEGYAPTLAEFQDRLAASRDLWRVVQWEDYPAPTSEPTT